MSWIKSIIGKFTRNHTRFMFSEQKKTIFPKISEHSWPGLIIMCRTSTVSLNVCVRTVVSTLKLIPPHRLTEKEPIWTQCEVQSMLQHRAGMLAIDSQRESTAGQSGTKSCLNNRRKDQSKYLSDQKMKKEYASNDIIFDLSCFFSKAFWHLICLNGKAWE